MTSRPPFRSENAERVANPSVLLLLPLRLSRRSPLLLTRLRLRRPELLLRKGSRNTLSLAALYPHIAATIIRLCPRRTCQAFNSVRPSTVASNSESARVITASLCYPSWGLAQRIRTCVRKAKRCLHRTLTSTPRKFSYAIQHHERFELLESRGPTIVSSTTLLYRCVTPVAAAMGVTAHFKPCTDAPPIVTNPNRRPRNMRTISPRNCPFHCIS